MATQQIERTGVQTRSHQHHFVRIATATLLLIVLCAVLGAVPSSTRLEAGASSAHTQLAIELNYARGQLGIPESFLAPVVHQEGRLATGAAILAPGQSVASAYTGLYQQLIAVEGQSLTALRSTTAQDLQTLTLLLSDRRNAGFTEGDAYQVRLDQALSAIPNARTPGDYVTIDTLLQRQINALQSLWPAFQSYLTLLATRDALQSLGLAPAQAAAWLQQDQTDFQAGLSVSHYALLSQMIDGQLSQLHADLNTALVADAPRVLGAYQTQVKQLSTYGEDVKSFQQAYTADVQLLQGTPQPNAYLTVASSLQTQMSAMVMPMARGKARYDLKAFADEIAQGQKQTTLDPFTGARYPAAYEYADKKVGYGLVASDVQGAVTLAEYQQADQQINILRTALAAMLTNMHDKTPAGTAHKTDLALLKQYGMLTGKVVVVSLREQVVRFYENGTLAFWSYTTTGSLPDPSPPGIHHADTRLSPITFTSTEAPGSPLWFAPTPVKYAIGYFPGGYFLHDAWWRSKFGPGTNLPHVDPSAFNGGSHGCINFPKEIMPKIWAWTTLHTPVVIY